MDYRIEKKASFNVLAKVEKFNNEVAGDRNDQEIPGFWTRCLNDDTFEVLNRYCGDKDTYGICAPLSKESQYFEYGIGKEYDGEEIPEGFKLWEVKPTIWAVFKCHGEDGKCISDTWDRIYQEFLPCSEYEMLDDIDFELYFNDKSDCFCEVWIPVKNKNN